MSAVVRRVFAVLVVAAAALALVVASRGHALSPDQRAHRLDRELRCPVCQGLSVADSPSSTSRAIAADVLRRVDAGESDASIRAYYVGRYGRWILLTPSGGVGRLAWAVPLALVLLAGVALAVRLRGWSRHARAPSPDDVAVVEQIRRRAVPQMEQS